MRNMGNSHPKKIMAAFAAATVIGGGACFALPGFLPAGDGSAPANPSSAEEPRGIFGGLMNKVHAMANRETTAKAVEEIVQLGRARDVESFRARIDLDDLVLVAVDAIKSTYPGVAKYSSDELLQEHAEAGLLDAMAGKKSREHDPGGFTIYALDLENVSYAGIADIKENGDEAAVSIRLASGESLPDGFVLSLIMEREPDPGCWNVRTVTNLAEYAVAVRDGRKVINRRFIDQYQVIAAKYDEAVAALNAQYPPLSVEYADGWEAAEQEFMASVAQLIPPADLKVMLSCCKNRDERVVEMVRLIRAYAAGDHSQENQRQRHEMTTQMGQINNTIHSIIISHSK